MVFGRSGGSAQDPVEHARAAWPSSCGQYRAAKAARASRNPVSSAAGSRSASTTSCVVASSGPGASASKSK
ncbi:hypothetical protein ACFQY7_33795 [Actinomadura luteofluorescens]|uniref:hypothetical protein n=1 Tax=Actinomadura luteofluorescens TaxID=46163 RepID=UPI003634C9FD